METFMTTLALNHVNIRIPEDLIASVRGFYCSVVGLHQGPRPPFASFGYWLYAGEQAVVHLTATGPAEVRLTDAATTLDHVAFSCENFATVIEALDAAGIRYEISEVPATGHKQLFFSDPAGNGIELNFADEGAHW
jgi:glyoxylase I family protein